METTTPEPLDIDPDAYVTDGIPRKEDSTEAHYLAAIGHDAKEQAARNVRAAQAADDRRDELGASIRAWDRKYARRFAR